MSELNLDAIEARYAEATALTRFSDSEKATADSLGDIPALVAYTRDLRMLVEQHKHFAEGWRHRAEQAERHGKFWAKERDEARAEVDRLIGMYEGGA